jgi:hypothetical protein
MAVIEGLSIVLLVSGIIVIFISFTNMENITGLWVAGKIGRDKQYLEAGRFKRKVYLILRWIGVVSFVSGVILMIGLR